MARKTRKSNRPERRKVTRVKSSKFDNKVRETVQGMSGHCTTDILRRRSIVVCSQTALETEIAELSMKLSIARSYQKENEAVLAGYTIILERR